MSKDGGGRDIDEPTLWGRGPGAYRRSGRMGHSGCQGGCLRPTAWWWRACFSGKAYGGTVMLERWKLVKVEWWPQKSYVHALEHVNVTLFEKQSLQI